MAAGGEGELDPEALARAEAALSALSDEYLRWIEADLLRLATALAALRSAGAAQWHAAAAAVFAVAHDIKGQAATFDYPLLSRLGLALCRLVHAAKGVDAVLLRRLDMVAEAMAQVVAQRLSGDGGADGRDLLRRLEVQVPGLSPEG